MPKTTKGVGNKNKEIHHKHRFKWTKLTDGWGRINIVLMCECGEKKYKKGHCERCGDA